jgi:hypothetical protein
MQQPDKNAECLSNLKQIAIALNMYGIDWDENLPSVTSSAQMQKLLAPYVRNPKVFKCPVCGLPYKFSHAFSGKTMVSFKNNADVVVAYDPKPHADGLYTVCYIDNHAKRLATLPKMTAVLRSAHK